MENNGTKSKTVTIKRAISIKVIVTEDFKTYLIKEIDDAIKVSNDRIAEVEKSAKEIFGSALSDTNSVEIIKVQQHLENERSQHQNTHKDLEQRKQTADNLALGDMFLQGSIEGIVNAKIGDNLYEKLGALEIHIKDGVIQDIVNIGTLTTSTDK